MCMIWRLVSYLGSQGCREYMYLFNAEPFPLPELQGMRLLNASALPQKKIFLGVTLRTQFLLDIIYHSHFLSFIFGNALIQKSLTLEWLHGPAWGGCYWPHSVSQTKPTQIRETALICGTLCLSSLKSSFSPFSCTALSPVHKCWWFNGFWVATLPHSVL